MTKKIGLQAFLRREVMKTKLQVPTENESPGFTKEASMLSAQPKIYEEPEENTFRNVSDDKQEDCKAPLERLRHSSTPFAVRYEIKPKSELRIRIEELRKQLLAIIDTSFKNSHERAISAKERDRLLRSIECLEAQEKREKDNALRGMGFA